MPHYYFMVRSCGHEHLEEHSAVLRDDAAALEYACSMIKKLSRKGQNDPGSLVSVRNELHETVLSVPFLAACA
jgi:hypothetical protein